MAYFGLIVSIVIAQGYVTMTAMTLATRLATVHERVSAAAARSGRPAEAVTLVGVCKMADRAAIDEAYAAGLRHFGENRVQDALAKFGDARPADLVLHLIGHLQTNKARDAVTLFQVDPLRRQRAACSTRSSARRARFDLVVPVLLEINIAGEASKQGVSPEAAEALVAHAAGLPHLRPRGLMTIAPLVDDAEAVRPVFRALRELRDRLRDAHPDWELPDLSMGMTNDYPVAIEEGATLVRVGRAIFASCTLPVACQGSTITRAPWSRMIVTCAAIPWPTSGSSPSAVTTAGNGPIEPSRMAPI